MLKVSEGQLGSNEEHLCIEQRKDYTILGAMAVTTVVVKQGIRDSSSGNGESTGRTESATRHL